MYKLIEMCELLDINVKGIIDKDYHGNTNRYCNLPILDSEDNICNYKDYNFFCATNWLPMQDLVSLRNKNKRKHLIQVIKNNNLSCISLIHPLSCVSKSAKIGRNVFIDALTLIEPNVSIGDFTSIYAQCAVGHDSDIMENCVLQRAVGVTSNQTLENDVFFANGVRALKSNVTFGTGTFVHEMIYLSRGTVANEIVSLDGPNTKRVQRLYAADVE